MERLASPGPEEVLVRIENREPATFCREVRVQEPTKRISRKPSRGFQAPVICSEDGLLLEGGSKDIFECPPLQDAS